MSALIPNTTNVSTAVINTGSNTKWKDMFSENIRIEWSISCRRIKHIILINTDILLYIHTSLRNKIIIFSSSNFKNKPWKPWIYSELYVFFGIILQPLNSNLKYNMSLLKARENGISP